MSWKAVETCWKSMGPYAVGKTFCPVYTFFYKKLEAEIKQNIKKDLRNIGRLSFKKQLAKTVFTSNF